MEIDGGERRWSSNMEALDTWGPPPIKNFHLCLGCGTRANILDVGACSPVDAWRPEFVCYHPSNLPSDCPLETGRSCLSWACHPVDRLGHFSFSGASSIIKLAEEWCGTGVSSSIHHNVLGYMSSRMVGVPWWHTQVCPSLKVWTYADQQYMTTS